MYECIKTYPYIHGNCQGSGDNIYIYIYIYIYKLKKVIWEVKDKYRETPSLVVIVESVQGNSNITKKC